MTDYTGNMDLNREIMESFNKTADKPPFSINELINQGKAFYDYSISMALKKALKHGHVATMPQLIAAKAKANKNSYLWDKSHNAYSEEVIGTYKGVEYLIIIHGDGILRLERTHGAYEDGLINKHTNLTQNCFNKLLEEKIVKIYDYGEEIPEPLGHYAIKIPLKKVRNTKSELTKKEFMNNPLVQARAGSKQYLEEFFDKAQSIMNTLFNDHGLEKINAETPQARLLSILYNKSDFYGGGSGYSLDSYYGISEDYNSNFKACFVAVARNKKEGDN